MLQRDRCRNRSLGLVLLVAFLAVPASAAEQGGLKPEDYFRLEIPNDPHLSPDGRRVAFVVASIDAQKRRRNTVWMASTDGSEPPRAFSAPGVSASAPRFSPDGRRLAFVSTRPGDGEPGADKAQLYVMSLDGGEARRLSGLTNGVGACEWSPDGTRFVCVSRTDPPKDELPFERGDTRRYRDISYKLDGQGWSDGRRAHLFVVDAGSGAARQITDGDWNDSDPEWSPDGERIGFVSDRRSRGGDWEGRHADVWVVGAAGGEPVRISDHDEADSNPTWSPDGRTIAFLGSLSEGDHPKLYVAPAQAGAASRPASAKMSHLSQRPAWSRDGTTLFFEALSKGASHLFAIDLASQDLRQLTHGARRLRGFDRNEAVGRMVYRGEEPVDTPDLFVADLDGSNERRLTWFNRELSSGAAPQPLERISWRGPLGWEIEGFLARPSGLDTNKRYPMLMWVHGGPNGMHGYEWSFDVQVLASHGYAVFLPNPRGSGGYGEAFQRSVANEWGGKAYDDLMAGVDAVVKANPWIDPQRLGVIGHSYGGFMTDWIVGHTARFKAAVTIAGISNLVSVQGTRDAAFNHRRDFGGDLFQSYERYWNTSPLKYAPQVRTPTLVLHGEADHRVPLEQGEQFFRALRHLGVETELVVFPRGSHGFRTGGEPRQVVEALNWQLWWMARHLGGQAPAKP